MRMGEGIQKGLGTCVGRYLCLLCGGVMSQLKICNSKQHLETKNLTFRAGSEGILKMANKRSMST